ncbi:MAG: hypothetical protein N3E41_00540 [Thermofilaceae archaeon]|nr:hypothetical protein [Thermofilaceae archaeon]
MDGRRLVQTVMEGLEPPRPPLHVESDDKLLEASFSDALGVGARVAEWRNFFESGGPFRRRDDEKLSEWVDRVKACLYEWPDAADAALEAVEVFLKKVEGLSEGKFLILKVLGPTETAEGFFAPSRSGRGVELQQILHRFGFGAFYALNSAEALKIYGMISRVILEVVKVGSELQQVDAVRVADDAATYSGPVYSRSFYEEAYYPWHERFVKECRKKGKYALLHCDGDIRLNGLIEKLADLYDGLHPLDLRPKSTVEEALKWVEEVASTRRLAGEAVFFTGVPVELVFNDSLSVEEFLKVPRKLLEAHGNKFLVVATTHSEYPSRSYGERLPRGKIERLYALIHAFKRAS